MCVWMCLCGCDCVCVGVIVCVCVGVIAWVRKGVCGWDSLDCCPKVCVCGWGECVWGCDWVGVGGCGWVWGVGVIAWVRRAWGSLDGWCMFVWCGRGVNYVGWDGSMWVRHL